MRGGEQEPLCGESQGDLHYSSNLLPAESSRALLVFKILCMFMQGKVIPNGNCRYKSGSDWERLGHKSLILLPFSLQIEM